MRKRILFFVLAVAFACSMDACRSKKDASTEQKSSTIEKKDNTKDSNTKATTESKKKTSTVTPKEDVDSDSTEEKIDRNEPDESETGNFEGLDTEEEINIDVDEGENTVGE